jgi:3-deoxy-7-phosphoheptulonate synthase
MIIHLKDGVTAAEASQLAAEAEAFHVVSGGKNVLILGSGVKEVPAPLESVTDEHWVFPNDMQLAARAYRNETRTVKVGNVSIGGNTGNTLLISGPCSVESEEQLR